MIPMRLFCLFGQSGASGDSRRWLWEIRHAHCWVGKLK